MAHISRWDLDKTYLRTEFDTVRDLVRTAFERADEKRTNPGAATLLREMARAGVSIHILSGSPEQMRRRLEDKLRLDGITWDSFVLKPNLQNMLRLRFRALKDQLGYKLPALLDARTALGASDARETLFGDDAEADAFVYSLYADIMAGRAFYNYLQSAFVVYEDGRLPAQGVLRVATELVTQHRFDGDALARSYHDLGKRGHLRGTQIPELADALDVWIKEEPNLAAKDELAAMVKGLPAYAEQAAKRFVPPAEAEMPDYLPLVGKHNPRRKNKR